MLHVCLKVVLGLFLSLFWACLRDAFNMFWICFTVACGMFLGSLLLVRDVLTIVFVMFVMTEVREPNRCPRKLTVTSVIIVYFRSSTRWDGSRGHLKPSLATSPIFPEGPEGPEDPEGPEGLGAALWPARLWPTRALARSGSSPV